jgi:hypothetical protein
MVENQEKRRADSCMEYKQNYRQTTIFTEELA